MKNLSMNIVKKYEQINRREDLDLRVGGDLYKGYDYKGVLPISALYRANRTWIEIDNWSMDAHYTHAEWDQAGGYELAHRYFGRFCSVEGEIDEQEFLNTCQEVLDLHNELNAKTKDKRVSEEQRAEILNAYDNEIDELRAFLAKAKQTIDLWSMPSWRAKNMVDYFNALVGDVYEMESRKKTFECGGCNPTEERRQYECLQEHGWVNQPYVRGRDALRDAMGTCEE